MQTILLHPTAQRPMVPPSGTGPDTHLRAFFLGDSSMQDQRTRDSTARDGAAAIGTAARVAPSSSRMLASYMTDIEQLLDEQRWEVALREALNLPQIAVALSDPHLSFTGERLKAWCDEWIRPAEPDRNARCAEYQRVVAAVLGHTVTNDTAAIVPSLALKQLRLRR